MFGHVAALRRAGVLGLVKQVRPAAIIHTAAQPSHDLAAAIPFDDFDTNAVGTLNLLEANRQVSAEVPFVHMSTNKVYGDNPNLLPLVEHPTRWEIDESHPYFEHGIDEQIRIADYLNASIRKVDRFTRVISTVAGSGFPGYDGDGGPATEATLFDPYFPANTARRRFKVNDIRFFL